METRTKAMIVTPELAKEWLESAGTNRGISQNRVKTYAEDMKNGNWQYNGEEIKFNESGELIDGQHRLHAIIRANTPVKMDVKFGVPDNVTLLDRGRPRSVADILRVGGMEKALANTTNIAIAKLAFQIDGKGRTTVSDFWVENFITQHSEALLKLWPILRWSHNKFPGAISTKNSPLLLAILRAYEAGEDFADLEEFAKVYRTGFVSGAGQESALHARNAFLGKKIVPFGSNTERIYSEFFYEKAIYDFCKRYPRKTQYGIAKIPTYARKEEETT